MASEYTGIAIIYTWLLFFPFSIYFIMWKTVNSFGCDVWWMLCKSDKSGFRWIFACAASFPKIHYCSSRRRKILFWSCSHNDKLKPKNNLHNLHHLYARRDSSRHNAWPDPCNNNGIIIHRRCWELSACLLWLWHEALIQSTTILININ